MYTHTYIHIYIHNGGVLRPGRPVLYHSAYQRRNASAPKTSAACCAPLCTADAAIYLLSIYIHRSAHIHAYTYTYTMEGCCGPAAPYYIIALTSGAVPQLPRPLRRAELPSVRLTPRSLRPPQKRAGPRRRPSQESRTGPRREEHPPAQHGDIRYIDLYLYIYLYTYIGGDTVRSQNHELVPPEKSILLRAQQI